MLIFKRLADEGINVDVPEACAEHIAFLRQQISIAESPRVPSTPPLANSRDSGAPPLRSEEDDAFFSSRRARAPVREKGGDDEKEPASTSDRTQPMSASSSHTSSLPALRPAVATWEHIQLLRTAILPALDERRRLIAEREAEAKAVVLREREREGVALLSLSRANTPGYSPVEGASAQLAHTTPQAALSTRSSEFCGGSASPDEHSSSPLPELFLSQAQGLGLHSGRNSPRYAGIKDVHGESRISVDTDVRRASKAPRLAAPQAVRKLIPTSTLAVQGISLASADDGVAHATPLAGMGDNSAFSAL